MRRRGLLVVSLLVIVGLVVVQQYGRRGYAPVGPPVQIGAATWLTDFDAASARAAAEGKPMLIVFGAAWCASCQTMKRDVWPDEQVSQAVAAGFVPLLVDADAPQQRPLLERYGVRGLPTVLITDAAGAVIRATHFMQRDDLLRFLDLSARSGAPTPPGRA